MTSTTLPYQVSRGWRPAKAGEFPIPLVSELTELLIQNLLGGPDLAYLRSKDPILHNDTSYYIRRQLPDDPVYMVMMKRGLIAFGHCAEAFLARQKGDFLRGIQTIANDVDGFVPYFENIPTTNDYYTKELETLRKIQSYTDRLKRGEFTDEELLLVWGIDGFEWSPSTRAR
jgi:hypothetical protein